MRQEPRAEKAASWAGWVAAAAAVGAATAAALVAGWWFELPDVAMLYLLVIMVVAVRHGRGPSVLAAALSTASYDFFFVPPLLSFAVTDFRNVLTFGVMFAVGLVISALAVRVRRQEEAAREREQRTAVLYALARDLAGAADEGVIGRAMAEHAAVAFAGGAAVLLTGQGEALTPVAQAGGLALDADALGVARWVFEHEQPAGIGTDTLPGARVRCWPLGARGQTLGVVALAPEREQAWRIDDRDFLDAFVRQGRSRSSGSASPRRRSARRCGPVPRRCEAPCSPRSPTTCARRSQRSSAPRAPLPTRRSAPTGRSCSTRSAGRLSGSNASSGTFST